MLIPWSGMGVVFALLQAAVAIPADGAPSLTIGCRSASQGDIIVCGSPNARSKYRLPELTSRYDRKPVRAQGTVKGADVAAGVSSTIRPDGLQDKRFMITISTAF